MKTTYTDMLKDPSLPLVIERMQNYLNEEAKLREKFYNDIDETQKAEFINGEIILHSPATYVHNLVMKHLIVAMDNHVELFDLGYVGFEKMMIHLTRNSYEPDICYFTTKQVSKFAKDEKLFPAPPLIVEVLSPSTESYDRDMKFNDYLQHNVKEYWIIDPINEQVEQYLYRNRKYQLNFNASEGVIKSEVIMGFELDVRILFDSNLYYEYTAKDKKQIIKLNKTLADTKTELTETKTQLTVTKTQLTEKDEIINELKAKLNF